MGTVDAAFLSGVASALRVQCLLEEPPTVVEEMPALRDVLDPKCVRRLIEDRDFLRAKRKDWRKDHGQWHEPHVAAGRCAVSLWDMLEACSTSRDLRGSGGKEIKRGC